MPKTIAHHPQNREYRQHRLKTIDPMLPIASYREILGYAFGHFGGPGLAQNS